MTITIYVWHVLAVLTVAGWAWAFLWPVKPSRGDYDFGPAVEAGWRGVCAISLTLYVWMFYFGGRLVLQ